MNNTSNPTPMKGIMMPFEFQVDSMRGHSYTNNGFVTMDDSLNLEFHCKKWQRAYAHRADLVSFFESEFAKCNYTYKNVLVKFYGKNMREVQVGRTYINCSYENKIQMPKSAFLPDLKLALMLLHLYDELNPYGFDKSFRFKDMTIEEIVAFFADKFNSFRVNYLLRKASLPRFCYSRIKSESDFRYWEDLYDTFKTRWYNEMHQGGALKLRSEKTVFFEDGNVDPLPLGKNVLGNYWKEEFNRALSKMEGYAFSVYKRGRHCVFRRKFDGKIVELWNFDDKAIELIDLLKK